jgi:hypothetical protein
MLRLATTNPLDHSAPAHPVEWLISLFVLPTAVAVAGFLCWRRQQS